MSLKDALANSLLMFVACCCVVLIVKALPWSAPATPALNNADLPGNPPAGSRDGITVYYFHGNTRCPTCKEIEAYTYEALQSGFAADLNSGKIAWQILNYEAPANKRFVTEYKIAAPTVVLVESAAGQQVRWRGLPEVWEHVGDKPKFVTYIQTNVREFMKLPNAVRDPATSSTTSAPATPSALPIPQ